MAQQLVNDTVARLIGDQFPELVPTRVTGRYEGGDHQADGIDGRWIFRFPKRAECLMPFRCELALLPQIDGKVPVTHELTAPIGRTDAFIGDPSHDFSYPWAWEGDGFVEQVLKNYESEVTPGFRKRLRFYCVCSAVEDLHYGLLTGVAHNREVGLAALARFAASADFVR